MSSNTFKKKLLITLIEESKNGMVNNIILYQLNMNPYILGLIILLLQIAQSKQLFISYSIDTQSIDLFKYLYSMQNEFFVDIGAYDPIYASNTANLLGWNGLNIEASSLRHRNFQLSRPHQMNLNMAVNNITGGTTNLIQYDEDSSASINTEFLKKVKNPNALKKEEKVPQITMADICHLFYPKRPRLMNLDIEGNDLVALMSNDWSQLKCKPEILVVQRSLDMQTDKNQKEVIEDNEYVFQKATSLNNIYIHQSVFTFYKQREEEGVKLLKNMIVKPWFPLFQSIFKIIVPNHQTDFKNFQHLNPMFSPVYLHFAYQQIISIEEIKSNAYFLANSFRPILIVHYNPLKSKLYFGSHQYRIEEIKLRQSQITLRKIQIGYLTETVQLYVLDHGIQAPNPLQILDKLYEQAVNCGDQKFMTHQKVVNTDNYFGK